MIDWFKRKYKERFNRFEVGDIIKVKKPDYLEEWEHFDYEVWEVCKVGQTSYLVRCPITEPFYVNKIKNRPYIRHQISINNNGPYGELGDGYFYDRLDKPDAALEYQKISESQLKINHHFNKDIKSLIE